jgi:hypothetical protein
VIRQPRTNALMTKPWALADKPRGFQSNSRLLVVEIMRPHNGSVSTNDRVCLKPIDLI